jgi:hypothetical protein
MIILRQKRYSFGRNVVNWSKGVISKIGQLLNNVLVGIKNFAKHIKGGGKEVKEHTAKMGEHGKNLERAFSDVPIKADFNQYCKAIPDYANLYALKKFNNTILEGTPDKVLGLIKKCFPSFLGLVEPEVITEYREDYINSKECPGDYAEILFTFGEELVYLWDFDKQSWYVQDRTYNPRKEWMISRRILEALKINFDPSKNQLLQSRLESWEKSFSDQPDGIKYYMRRYCDRLLGAINKMLDR